MPQCRYPTHSSWLKHIGHLLANLKFPFLSMSSVGISHLVATQARKHALAGALASKLPPLRDQVEPTLTHLCSTYSELPTWIIGQRISQLILLTYMKQQWQKSWTASPIKEILRDNGNLSNTLLPSSLVFVLTWLDHLTKQWKAKMRSLCPTQSM